MSRRATPTPAPRAGDHSIRVVSAKTGIEMGTLRAWERRYGFPRPERRDDSNRRVYTSDDVARLVAIQSALGRGYRIGDVIGKTLNELAALAPVTEGGLPSREVVAASITSSEELIALLTRDAIGELDAQLRRAAVALGPRSFVTDVAHPFAVGVGAAWAEGKLTVAHEHLATECLTTQLRQMLAGYQDIAGRPLVLLATLPGEPHTLPLQMIALYLVALGAKPRLLGGSTPPKEIATSARSLGADVVGLTVTATSNRKRARTDVQTLRSALPSRFPLWIGGGGATALRTDDEHTHVVTSWTAIDQAIALHRATPTH